MKANYPIHHGVPERQRGAVLFVALIFLILLTLLGLAASGNSILQERMTGGVRNRQLALMGSESAARGGEVQVFTAPSRANLSTGGMVFPSCSGGAPQPCAWDQLSARYSGPRAPSNMFRTVREWSTTVNSAGTTYTPALSGLTGYAETASIAVQPVMMYEDLGLDSGGFANHPGRMGGSNEQEGGGTTNAQRRIYRVTARSQGGNGEAAIRVNEVVYSSFTTGGSFTSN